MDAAQSSANRERPQLDPVFVFWLVALFVITGLGALPLFFYRIDLSKLTFSSPIPVLVGIGIEITAYAPTLAALLVVAVVPGGGGIGRLLRPVARWRIGLSWYLLALLGPSVLFIMGDLVRLGLVLALPPHWLVIPGADSVQHGDPVVATLYVVAAIAVVLATRSLWLRPLPRWSQDLSANVSPQIADG